MPKIAFKRFKIIIWFLHIQIECSFFKLKKKLTIKILKAKGYLFYLELRYISK